MIGKNTFNTFQCINILPRVIIFNEEGGNIHIELQNEIMSMITM